MGIKGAVNTGKAPLMAARSAIYPSVKRALVSIDSIA